MKAAAHDVLARAAVLCCLLVGGCRPHGNPPELGPEGRAPPASRWVAYESAECGVRVDFPGIPVIAVTEIPTGEGPRAMESGTLALPGGDRAMVATCTDVGIAIGTEGLMDAAEKGMLARTGATLIAEQPSIGGRELRLSVHDAEIWA